MITNMLATYNNHFDRTGDIFQQQELSAAPAPVNVATRPLPPAARHRRGLSLDQGIARSRHKAPNLHLEPFEPLQWQNIAPGLIDDALSYRSNTPFETDSESLPLTPATTPCWKPAQLARACKTAQSSPVKHPVMMPRNGMPMDRAKSLQGMMDNFGLRETNASLANTDCLSSLDPFDLRSPKLNDELFSEFTFPMAGNLEPPTVSSPTSPTIPSFLSLSSIIHSQNSISTPRKPAKIPIAPVNSTSVSRRATISSRSSSPAKALLSPRALSIADLNLDSTIDASIEETGITLDDIAAHIEGPDPIDNKWVCTYEGCNKRFGRKENIKSHVQTHLGDRQFKCNHCNKCFVRGHDLKRHSKIHTGVKPYPCECGNSFARHDALTRHKQRGMCSGAFANAVRKPLRRGRPKKRPDIEERREKSSKTRERVKRGHTRTLSESSCASFMSSASECTDTADIGESTFAKDLAFLENSAFALPPDAFSFTPPASPSYSTGNISSPTRSYHSLALDPDLNPIYLSPSKRPLDDIPEEIPDMSLLAPDSPSPVKADVNVGSPVRVLWPAVTVSDDIAKTGQTNLDDIFIGHASTMNRDRLPAHDPSSLTEPGSSRYEDEYFLNHNDPHEADLINTQLFPLSFSPETEAFFDRFTIQKGV